MRNIIGRFRRVAYRIASLQPYALASIVKEASDMVGDVLLTASLWLLLFFGCYVAVRHSEPGFHLPPKYFALIAESSWVAVMIWDTVHRRKR